MYTSNQFRSFMTAQANTFGEHYRSYVDEFKNYSDEELVERLSDYTSQLSNYEFNSDTFNDYFSDVQRMLECLKLRQQFQQEVSEDDEDEE